MWPLFPKVREVFHCHSLLQTHAFGQHQKTVLRFADQLYKGIIISPPEFYSWHFEGSETVFRGASLEIQLTEAIIKQLTE